MNCVTKSLCSAAHPSKTHSLSDKLIMCTAVCKALPSKSVLAIRAPSVTSVSSVIHGSELVCRFGKVTLQSVAVLQQLSPGRDHLFASEDSILRVDTFCNFVSFYHTVVCFATICSVFHLFLNHYRTSSFYSIEVFFVACKK